LNKLHYWVGDKRKRGKDTFTLGKKDQLSHRGRKITKFQKLSKGGNRSKDGKREIKPELYWGMIKTPNKKEGSKEIGFSKHDA